MVDYHTPDQVEAFNRRQLQKICKQVGIKANQKTVLLQAQLNEYFAAQEQPQPQDSPVSESVTEVVTEEPTAEVEAEAEDVVEAEAEDVVEAETVTDTVSADDLKILTPATDATMQPIKVVSPLKPVRLDFTAVAPEEPVVDIEAELALRMEKRKKEGRMVTANSVDTLTNSAKKRAAKRKKPMTAKFEQAHNRHFNAQESIVDHHKKMQKKKRKVQNTAPMATDRRADTKSQSRSRSRPAPRQGSRKPAGAKKSVGTKKSNKPTVAPTSQEVTLFRRKSKRGISSRKSTGTKILAAGQHKRAPSGITLNLPAKAADMKFKDVPMPDGDDSKKSTRRRRRKKVTVPRVALLAAAKNAAKTKPVAARPAAAVPRSKSTGRNIRVTVLKKGNSRTRSRPSSKIPGPNGTSRVNANTPSAVDALQPAPTQTGRSSKPNVTMRKGERRLRKPRTTNDENAANNANVEQRQMSRKQGFKKSGFDASKKSTNSRNSYMKRIRSIKSKVASQWRRSARV
jgi:hypothetical protein